MPTSFAGRTQISAVIIVSNRALARFGCRTLAGFRGGESISRLAVGALAAAFGDR